MSRLEQRFAELKAEGRSALVTFVTAGDPGYEASLQILRACRQRGRCDRTGHAVHRPDGRWRGHPACYPAGLEAGQTLAKTLQMVREFRVDNYTTPIVLMGYYNPIHRFGVDKFVAEAKEAGVDGLIIVDLPPEHDAELATPAQAAGIDFIRLTTPTTDDARLPRVLERSSGFVYYVSVAGVTGAGSATTEHVTEAIARLRRHTDLPISVGFGIRTPEQAAAIARLADGVVVGSALVDKIAQAKEPAQAVNDVLSLCSALAEGVRGARR